MQFRSWKDLADRRTTSVSTEKRRVKNDPRHPRPVQISPGRVGFPAPETDEYDLLLIAERDTTSAKNGEDKPVEASDPEGAIS